MAAGEAIAVMSNPFADHGLRRTAMGRLRRSLTSGRLQRIVDGFLDQLGRFIGSQIATGKFGRDVVDYTADCGPKRLIEEQRVPMRAIDVLRDSAP